MKIRRLILYALTQGFLLVPAMATTVSFLGRPADTVKLQLSDKTQVVALTAGDAAATQAVLLAHDWFGLSEFVFETMQRFAEKGMRVLAVDLYNGQSATTHPEAWRLMQTLDKENAAAILQAGIDFLRKPGRKMAVMGFSMGTTYAIEATLAAPQDVSATVLIYGTPVFDKESLQRLQSPVLAITGSRDNPAELFKFSEMMEEAGKLAEIYIYPGAGHAYSQPLFNAGKNLDETATRLTWMLTDDFLMRHLK